MGNLSDLWLQDIPNLSKCSQRILILLNENDIWFDCMFLNMGNKTLMFDFEVFVINGLRLITYRAIYCVEEIKGLYGGPLLIDVVGLMLCWRAVAS